MSSFRRKPESSLYIAFLSFLFSSPLTAGDLCQNMSGAWKNIQSYQCTYRIVSGVGEKRSETLMRYTYQKPGKIRMDIEKPQKGAVLIYNPEISSKVSVRPFSRLPFFILHYELTNKKVTSDSGGTVDKSDLGNRIQQLCEERDNLPKRKIQLNDQNLPVKIEVYDGKGALKTTYEWMDMKINPELISDLFFKF